MLTDFLSKGSIDLLPCVSSRLLGAILGCVLTHSSGPIDCAGPMVGALKLVAMLVTDTP